MARMRNLKEAWNYIRETDSETSLTPHSLRFLANTGKIKSFRVGNRILIDIDLLMETLSAGIDPQEQHRDGIRPIKGNF